MFTDDQSQTPNTSGDPLKDLLSGITNEDGKQKYDDVEKALVGLKNSQDFISTLKTEKSTIEQQLAEAQAELAKRSSVEDVVSKLITKDGSQTPPTDTPSNTGLDEKSIEALIAKTLNSSLASKSAEDTKRANQSKVVDALTEQFGDQAKAKFAEIAKDSGLSTDELVEISAKSPELVLKLVPSKPADVNLTTGSQNSNSFSFSQTDQSGKIQPSATSVLAGASTQDLKAEMLRHKEAIYKKYNING